MQLSDHMGHVKQPKNFLGWKSFEHSTDSLTQLSRSQAGPRGPLATIPHPVLNGGEVLRAMAES